MTGESIECLAVLCRYRKRGEPHTGELFKYAHVVGARIPVTLVRSQDGR